MDLVYASDKVKSQCTSIKAANKLFGGDAALSKSLLSRINALRSANNIKDIIVQPTFRFHALKNKKGKDLEGYFAIDVKSIREPWRIIVQPLNSDKQPYNPCNIDEVAEYVIIVEITEVSRHYE
ncbi:MAG: hypothetical protein HFG76_03385 [Hungatella sp.]|nr:hypothetical protein [Hungatella sp.]